MTELKQQYYSIKELTEISRHIEVTDLKLVSTDTYSDEEIYAAILETGKAELLACAAIQMCVVGFGNKIYGSFKYKDVTYDVLKLFDECNVKCNLTLTSKIEAHELTPRRLQRFFRFHVYQFLEKNKTIKPYLWRKYSTRIEKFRSTTFPGAESLILNDDEVNYLLETYRFLDQRNNTKISDRIHRVFEARGLKEIV